MFKLIMVNPFGKSVWKQKEFNVTPYGTETMHLLRAEKGFIIVGQDTDATIFNRFTNELDSE